VLDFMAVPYLFGASRLRYAACIRAPADAVTSTEAYRTAHLGMPMRHWLTFCLLAFALIACSDSAPTGTSSPSDVGETSDAGETHDTGRDVAQADGSDADSSEDCTCSGASTCCDGCHPRNVGDNCDDGLECTQGTSCQPDGTCAGSTSSPCDDAMDEPQCQTATCDETAGCTITNTREGFECDDGDDGTYDDRCEAGVCAGEPCECEGDSTCCDGCHIISDDYSSCDDGNPNKRCLAGECKLMNCECDSGECCDGCNIRPGNYVCDSEERWSCDGGGCGGSDYVLERREWFCTGHDSVCIHGTGTMVATELQRVSCGLAQQCSHQDGCYESSSCE
jgi:hypothetical protein